MTYEGVDVELHVFLTSVLGGGEWSASRPGSFTTEGTRIHIEIQKFLLLCSVISFVIVDFYLQ